MLHHAFAAAQTNPYIKRRKQTLISKQATMGHRVRRRGRGDHTEERRGLNDTHASALSARSLRLRVNRLFITPIFRRSRTLTVCLGGRRIRPLHLFTLLRSDVSGQLFHLRFRKFTPPVAGEFVHFRIALNIAQSLPEGMTQVEP